MRRSPGRLYRKLSAAPKPLFKITGAWAGTFADDDLTSIRIRRGGADYGIHPSTCEVALPRYYGVRTGDTIDLELTAGAASWIQQRTGATGLGPRFHGRIGVRDYEDNGGTVDDRPMTFAAASWTAQALRSQVSVYAGADTQVSYLLSRALTAGRLAEEVNTWFPGTYDRLSSSVQAPPADVLTKYTADLGLLLQDQRHGTQSLLDLETRRTRALAALHTDLAIGRSQVPIPARWTQPNEFYPIAYIIRHKNTDGTDGYVRGGFPWNPESEVSDLDRRYITKTTPQLELYAQGLGSRGLNTLRIDSIRLDLLHLLSSDRTYDRRIAGQLLALQPGDAVQFGFEWPPAVRGVYFAREINETITGTTWEIELGLTKWVELLGSGMPEVPIRVWEQANTYWDDETRTWNEA